MIYSYGITQQGTLHQRQNSVCQDAHRIAQVSESLLIAAVADGLGSESHSDVAARLAVDLSVSYCADMITQDMPSDRILTVIQEAFSRAQDAVEQTAHDNGDSPDQYDTTLTLAVLRNTELYYGHSGDSGIIALTIDGLYQKVTEQQRDDEGRVFPLFFRLQKWEFGAYPLPVVSVFLATDGMLEPLFPVLLHTEPNPLYIKLARYFMDPEVLHLRELGKDEVQKRRADYLASIPDSVVNDDKTLVVLVNADVTAEKQPPEYYQEPDWAALRQKHLEAWKKLAYPSLYAEKPVAQEAGAPTHKDPIAGISSNASASASTETPAGAPVGTSVKTPAGAPVETPVKMPPAVKSAPPVSPVSPVSSPAEAAEAAVPVEKRPSRGNTLKGFISSAKSGAKKLLNYLDTPGSPDFYDEEQKNLKK